MWEHPIRCHSILVYQCGNKDSRAFNSKWKIIKGSANATVSHPTKDELAIQRLMFQ